MIINSVRVPIIICLILKCGVQAEHKWILCPLCFTKPNTEKSHSAFCQQNFHELASRCFLISRFKFGWEKST